MGLWFFLAFYCSGISAIGFGGGVVAMVHPIQAPIARTATSPMSTGATMNQILVVSRAGTKRAKVNEIAIAAQMIRSSQPIP